MRILLTRAAEDSARTKAILESLGHHVMVSPVIAFEATGAPWPAGAVDAVLATSGQAFAACPAHKGLSPEARRLMPLWLVGQRTHDVARTKNFDGPAFVAANAASLALAIVDIKRAGRILYLAGRDRKNDIETAMSGTDYRLETLEVYEASALRQLQPQSVKALESNLIDVVVHFSRRSAFIYVELVEAIGLKPRALNLCLSEDVTVPVAKAGFPYCLAERPTEASIVETLSKITLQERC